MTNYSSPDLTQQPPRSPRVRLGGFAILPRVIDKCRAVLAGTNGDYNYACALDQHFFTFTKIDPEAMKAEIAAGKGDGEILAWVMENLGRDLSLPDILAWSAYHQSRSPDNPTYRAKFNKMHETLAPDRTDIVTSFDMLDLDDYVSFGGKA
ncbi:DUF5069 domain-containing protein [Pelagicoccus albus]|uniref:DUF5069 domain-containing protein n=1 Tax=Pelagicoccus albus TaxID=415222 RepID=A0A7X1EA68_9BACT|nr:DUF5069 domain-containing protein [Pelagicoccus albus]MBC2607938.1 DUF5069 domain-containing protein [Pelagicoccus albus]